MLRNIIFFIFVIIISPFALAHFPMLIHDVPYAKLGEAVNVTFSVGHPYEQEYADAKKPEKVTAILPTGKKMDFTSNLMKKTVEVGGSSIQTWTLNYSPQQKGDTIIALDTKPEVGPNNTIFQDFIKIFIHTERQDGWRQRTGQPIEIVPLTRPYGFEAGSVFTGRLMKGDEPVAGAEIEIEQRLTVPPEPEDLPPEPMITKVVVTDPNGVFTCTLPYAGWWICGGYVEDAGQLTKNEKEYNLSGFAGIWILMEQKFIAQ